MRVPARLQELQIQRTRPAERGFPDAPQGFTNFAPELAGGSHSFSIAAPGPDALAGARRPQIIIGLDDLAQTILAGTVAAIGIRMVALHQSLETHLNIVCGRIDLKAQDV